MLPFTSEILFASVAVYNRASWPLPLIALVLALGALLLVVRPARHTDRIVATLLAAAWLWTGYGYLYLHHGQLDFAAPLYAFFFLVEGTLLAWTGLVRARLFFRFQSGPASWLGLPLAVAAIAAWPLADWLTTGDWRSARIVGLTPGPTAVFTLGLLLLSAGRTPLHLVVIPLLWTIVAGATAWVLMIPHDLAMPALGILALALILWKNRRAAG